MRWVVHFTAIFVDSPKHFSLRTQELADNVKAKDGSDKGQRQNQDNDRITALESVSMDTSGRNQIRRRILTLEDLASHQNRYASYWTCCHLA